MIYSYSFYLDERNYYIASECLHGGELFDKIIERQRFSEDETAVIVEQVLMALTYIHSKGIVHRDIKPENILFSKQQDESYGCIRLIDFGLASKKDCYGKLYGRYGTCYYIAPEVVRDTETGYDEKCDIWSIGIIMFLLLFGYPPFSGENDDMIMQSVVNGFNSEKFPKSDDLTGHTVSPVAKDMILQMLSLDPSRRPPAANLLAHPWIQARTNRGKIIRTETLRATSLKVFNHEETLQNAVMLYICSKLATEEELEGKYNH